MTLSRRANAGADSGAGNGNRILWLDALRALAACLVVLGHQMPHQGTPFFAFMKPLEMPLFFILTGYFFKGNISSPKELMQYLFFRILIPWLTLDVSIRVLGRCVRGDFAGLLELPYLMLSGKQNWYMICYMICYTILVIFHKIIKRFPARILALFAIGSLGLICGYFKIAQFAELNTAMTVQLFLALGLLLREYKDKILALPWWTVAASVAVYVLLGLATCRYYPGTNLDVNRNQYYNYAISLAMVFFGNYALIRIFEGAARGVPVPKFVAVIGRNTLVIYLLHNTVIAVLRKVLQLGGVTIDPLWLRAMLYTVFGVAVGVLAGELLNWLCPALIGNYKIQRSRKDSV